MRILKLKPDKPIQQAIPNGQKQFEIEMGKVCSDQEQDKSKRRFSIRKLEPNANAYSG